MGWQAELRAMEAARRRQDREAKKRQRELERQTKERAKLSDLERARLEVETYENAVEVLLSVHKEQASPMDWLSIAASLPPVAPSRQSHNELRVRRRLAVMPRPKDAEALIAQASRDDEGEHQKALQSHAGEQAEWEKMSKLARQVLAGDGDAYIAAVEEVGPFSELAGIGSSLHLRVHTPRLVEVVLRTNGRQAIPAEFKTLTASGKVVVKALPRPRFVETYQDYVCGCVLRVARELFALLPIETLLISASAESLDTATGQMAERQFLSAVISRAALRGLNFDLLDPSDSIMALPHRGDLKASRKTGEFEVIAPLTVADVAQTDAPASAEFGTLLDRAQRLRADLAAQCAALNPEPDEASLTNGETG